METIQYDQLGIRGVSMNSRIIRLPSVLARTGLSRSTIYNRISQGKFPTSISLGSRAVGWIESEVTEWLNQQIEASRVNEPGHTTDTQFRNE